MGRSRESAPLRVMHHSIKRCWRAAVVAMLAVAGTANSADAPPLLSPEQPNAGEIQLALQKIDVLGRVLYIAAHPDDENTNLMAHQPNGLRTGRRSAQPKRLLANSAKCSGASNATSASQL